MKYHYFGLLFGKSKVALVLLSAIVSTGHAAVWSGTSNPSATYWVQAGIADEGGQRFAYIEEHTPKHYSISEYPVPASVRVHLLSRGGRWRVTIDHRSSAWVWVPHPQRMACLELLGDSHAKATIDGVFVSA